jgi:hypothetical protein
MNFEIRKPVTRASTTSSGKRKRSGSEGTDSLKSSTTRQNNGKTGKQLTGQICGRCQELKIPVNLAQDGTILTVPSSGGEVVMGQNQHQIWHVPFLEGEDGEAKLQRLLFDIDFPLTKDCTVCEYLAEMLEHGFGFRPFSDEDIHALGLPKSEYKDNWIEFGYTGARFQLYCSKNWMRLALAVCPDIHTENNTGLEINLGLEQTDIFLSINQLDYSAAVSFKLLVRIIHFYLDG